MTFDYELEISCLNGGSLESFFNASDSDIAPNCIQSTESTIVCDQNSMTFDQGVAVLVDAWVYFECHGLNASGQLLAKATLSFKNIVFSSATSYARHVVELFPFDTTTNDYGYADTTCSKERIALEDQTTGDIFYLCGDESECSFACTASLDEVTVVQNTPIDSVYISSLSGL